MTVMKQFKETNHLHFTNDRDKSQGKRIQSTELVISDSIAKRDGLDGLTVNKLVEGIVSRTKRQRDGRTLLSGRTQVRQTDVVDGFQ